MYYYTSCYYLYYYLFGNKYCYLLPTPLGIYDNFDTYPFTYYSIFYYYLSFKLQINSNIFLLHCKYYFTISKKSFGIDSSKTIFLFVTG